MTAGRRDAAGFRHGRMALGIACLVSGCGDSTEEPTGPPPLTAATLGEQAIRPPAAWLDEAPYADADRTRGDRLLLQCRSCHNLEAAAGHTLGPNLDGMFGRPAGSAPGFGYTQAFRNADFVWTPRAVDAWLARPSTFLPGNAMAFAGVPDAGDRAALIASLLRQTTTGGGATDAGEQ